MKSQAKGPKQASKGILGDYHDHQGERARGCPKGKDPTQGVPEPGTEMEAEVNFGGGRISWNPKNYGLGRCAAICPPPRGVLVEHTPESRGDSWAHWSQEDDDYAGKFKREDYAVCQDWFEKICDHLCAWPTLDCFASAWNAKADKFLTVSEDGLKTEWGDDICWVNPPFSMWASVAKKVMKTSCWSICIVPEWNCAWAEALKKMASRRLLIQRGSRLFEVDGVRCPPIKWDCWVLFVQGSSVSKRRRARRKVLEKALAEGR